MNERPDDPELRALYREGRTWGDDRLAGVERSKRLAWWIAGAGVAVAVLEAIALAGLVPLRTVVPYTVLVDRQTGYVTTVDPSKAVDIAPDAALTRSQLAQYVVARETIDRAGVAADYRKVVLWSGGSARASYLEMMKAGNADNPYIRTPRATVIRAEIRSVSTLEPGSAMVRYDLITGSAGGGAVAQPYVSLLRYAYRKRPLTEGDRFINPLGFEVVSYRRDPEAVPVRPSTTAVVVPGYAPGTALTSGPAAEDPDPQVRVQ